MTVWFVDVLAQVKTVVKLLKPITLEPGWNLKTPSSDTVVPDVDGLDVLEGHGRRRSVGGDARDGAFGEGQAAAVGHHQGETRARGVERRLDHVVADLTRGLDRGRERAADELLDEEKALVLNVLDGAEAKENAQGTMLIATTNYPEAIDERVLKRPGRLDRVFIVPEVRISYPGKDDDAAAEEVEDDEYREHEERRPVTQLLQLVKPVDTRWNSTMYMIQR